MSRHALTLALVGLFAALPAAGQQISDFQVFPIVARTAGVGGTQWVSDLTMFNPHDHALTVGLQFFPADQANTFNFLMPDRVTLDPRETVIFEDVLHGFFGYDTDIKGALVASSDHELIPANPENDDFTAVTRTYNIGSPLGTFGQTIPALESTYNPGLGSSFATGARNDDRFRSNLGIVNLSLDEEIRVHYRIRSANGTILVEGLKAIPAVSVRQWSFAQLGIGHASGPLTVELWLDPGSVTPDPCNADFPNMFVGYVSKVDGNPTGTGDGEFIYAAPAGECPDD
ncbi:MAG TPA: hypothetical protein PKJ99_12650 [Thermoanaerobaculales bacterium]|nr:hypothetical protein [Thermoanaerobaculales bacterium]HPA82073.1 hypothetical protein [Thermoanaerobaculales bacterium]HQL30818.1 hypothetical protein [Thermoanaerobaculales bacterium]HQN97557.1 hypothetical protein [Thermoanaerobaculales bacterium]HQP43269.1 hypothetical protein [Thermoanaerobaculales bacterium]